MAKKKRENYNYTRKARMPNPKKMVPEAIENTRYWKQGDRYQVEQWDPSFLGWIRADGLDAKEAHRLADIMRAEQVIRRSGVPLPCDPNRRREHVRGRAILAIAGEGSLEEKLLTWCSNQQQLEQIKT